MPCRPLTNGITYVATNVVVGTQITWFSTIRRQWLSGSVVDTITGGLEIFSDGMTAWTGIIGFNGPQALSGDSGSPVFTTTGDFVCSVDFISGTNTYGVFAYPNNSRVRPAPSPTLPSTFLQGDPE